MKKMEKEIISVLKKMISFKTIDGNEEEMKSLLEYVKTLVSSDFVIKEYTFINKPVMVISNTDSKDLDVVFCTHIDVVPHEEYELIEKNDFLYGRGTFDMKGGTVVSLLAFLNQKTDKKVGIFLTSDEEIGGNCVRELLNIYHPKFGIIPDGGNNFDLIKEEKGRLLLKVSITTTSAHAAELYKGENAIITLFSVYQKLLKKYPVPNSDKEWKSSICLTHLSGGVAYNQVPDYAEMILDIRRITTDFKAEFINSLKKLDKRLKIEVLASETPYLTNIDDDMVKLYLKSVEKVLKKEPVITHSNSTCDGIYFTEKGIPTVLMNPSGGFAHAPNEFVEKESLFKLYEIYTDFLKNI